MSMSRPPEPPVPTPRDRVERFRQWTKTNPVVAALVVLGIVVGGVASFTDSALRLVASATKLIGSPASEAAAVPEVRDAAQVVGRYYARAIAQQVLDYRPPTSAELKAMESALRQMLTALRAKQQAEKAPLAEAALAVVSKLRRVALPEYWQVDELRSQREELARIFQALGAPLAEAEAPPASSTAVK